jgi:hypothetical protein
LLLCGRAEALHPGPVAAWTAAEPTFEREAECGVGFVANGFGCVLAPERIAAIVMRQPVRQAIEACGAELRYLPPYSPDFNPIENAFAKFKAHLHKSAARTLDALERAAANALRQFEPDECANFFAHAGYGLD